MAVSYAPTANPPARLATRLAFLVAGFGVSCWAPLVPYAKFGLAYGIWWITKGDGSVSETPSKGKAYGGTLGWTGTLGLAIRADMFDPDATRNLQTELGVEHAGFFFEVVYADVSGLGMENKLHVGDFTWFAGINFEF